VHADHLGRALGGGGDAGDADAGGVGGQGGCGRGQLVELGEDFELKVNVLGGCFNYQRCILRPRRHIRETGNVGERGRFVGLRNALLLYNAAQAFVDRAKAPVEGCLVDVYEAYFMALCGENLGNAGAHLAGADYGYVHLVVVIWSAQS